MNMKLDADKVVIKVKVVDAPELKAIISLDFGDFVVKGFRIRKSDFESPEGKKLWVTPPSYKGAYKWHPIFYVPNKELWKRLEERMLEEYEQQSHLLNKRNYGVD